MQNVAGMIDLVFGRRLIFESPLGQEAVATRLQQEIAPPRMFPSETRPQQFEGTFMDGRFRMMRQVRGRNSFRSVISGVVSPGDRGARIDVRLQLHPVVTVVCSLFLLAAVAIASVAIPEYLTTGSSPGMLFVIAATVVFGLFAISAAAEARKSTRMLVELFGAQPGGPGQAERRAGDPTFSGR